MIVNIFKSVVKFIINRDRLFIVKWMLMFKVWIYGNMNLVDYDGIFVLSL